MGSALVKKAQSGGLAALLASNAVERAVKTLKEETNTGSGSYFQFSGKDGKYSLNGQEIDIGTEIVFDIETMKKGRICWEDLRPHSRAVVGVFSGEPIPELPPVSEWDKGARWSQLVEVQVIMLEDGTRAQLGLSSGGGARALTLLLEAWYLKVRQHVTEAGDPMLPVVEIGMIKKTGKDEKGMATVYYVPTFKITDWIDPAELALADEGEEGEGEEEVGEEEEVVEEAPPPKTTTVKKPVVAGGFRSGLRGKRA